MKKTTFPNRYPLNRDQISVWQKGFYFLFVLFSMQFASAQVAVIDGLNGATLPTGWASTAFYSTATNPCEGSGAFSSNLYTFTTTANITSANYVGVSNGTDVSVNFKWKTVEYSTGSGIGLNAVVEYSLNDGSTWNSIGTFSSTAITSCANFTATIPAAAVPSGSNFKFRITANQTAGDFYVYVDDISVTQVTTVPPQCTTLLSPANLATNINSSVIIWNVAPGIPTGYFLSVGTTAGGSELLNMVDVGNVTTYNLGSLAAGTTYYVRLIPYNPHGSATGCSESSFTTCGASTAPTTVETFATYTPGCWVEATGALTASSTLTIENSSWASSTGFANAGTNKGVRINLYGGSTTTPNNNWIISNSIDLGTTPNLFQLRYKMAVTSYFGTTAQSTLGTHQVRVVISTDNGATWSTANVIKTYTGAATYSATGAQEIVSLTGYTGVVKIGFLATTVSTSPDIDFHIDDFVVETIPACASPTSLVATNATLTTATISWSPSVTPPANGYEFFYSTSNTAPAATATPSGSTLAGVTTANLTLLTANSTYYFWVRAVCDSASSSAWGGPGTFFTGYCQSNPTSVDNAGVTNVQIGTTNFPNSSATYNYNATPVVSLAQGINANVQVSFATGYTYMTTIWIDFNDNLIFEPSEQVFTGLSTNANPNTFNASFIMPAGAQLGQHRMRIGTQDDESATPNPCYGGSYGATIDFEVNVIAASCTPPAATAVVTADCANNQYFVAVNVTSLGSGTPTITDGTTTIPVTTLGIVQVGPYVNGSTHALTLNNGTDVTCDVPLGNFTYNCPPANDDCSAAISLTVNPDLSCGAVTAGTTVGATQSMSPGPCYGNPDDDVWYSFVATATAHNVSLLNVNPVSGTSTDMYFQVLSGACGSTTSMLCSDNDSAVVSGLTIGETYLVRVYSYYNTSFQTFNICVGTLPPAPANDACSTATAITSFPYTNTIDATSATNNGGFITACTTGGGEMNDGVWYTVVGDGGTLTIEMTNVVGWDPQLAAFTGSCGTFTCVASADNGGTDDGETISIPASVLGTTYYINAAHYSGFGDSPEGPFTINVTTSTMATNTFDSAGFSYYPNPVKDMLSLSYTKNITAVNVYNLIGQQVITSNFNATTGQLDMSKLASGAYIVKVTSENLTKSIKVIKE